MVTPHSSMFVYATYPDGTELFGVRAFRFRQAHVDAVAYDVDRERRVLTAEECRFEVLDPEQSDRLPSESLWLQANHDPVLRRAIKERCEL